MPTMRMPNGYYRSTLHPGMFFRRRHDLAIIPGEAAVRHWGEPTIRQRVESEEYAAEGKRLSSEDAHRYGAASSAGELAKYFDWRASVGLSWWLEIESRFPSASNDNQPQKAKVAA